MKQKYLISVGENENELVIKESGELDKGIFSTLFEEKYDKETIKTACEKDEMSLIAALRTSGFYPVGACAEKIAKGVTEFLETGCVETKEVLFNDVEILKTSEQAELAVSEEEADPVELDKLLEDESNIDDETILGDDDIKTISSSTTTSIKIADDDSIQTEDEP